VIARQGELVFHTSGGVKFSYDVVVILTFVEEAGLKILKCTSFADAEKRNAVFAWVKAQAQGSAPS
jgi:hypothetical protein